MKRRITLEVDDAVLDAACYGGGLIDAGSQLVLMLGQARIPGARGRATENLRNHFGIALISDEQVDL